MSEWNACRDCELGTSPLCELCRGYHPVRGRNSELTALRAENERLTAERDAALAEGAVLREALGLVDSDLLEWHTRYALVGLQPMFELIGRCRQHIDYARGEVPLVSAHLAEVERLREAPERCSDMCRWRSSDHYATCEDNCKLGRAEECPADIPRILARGGADEGSEF